MNSNKIKTIISILDNDTELNINTTSYDHHRFNVIDFATQASKLFNLLPEIYNIIESVDSKSNILVHCMVGASRSATAVIYYIMRKYDIKNFDKVYKKVQSKRSVVRPNSGFKDILTKFENNLCINYKLPESDINDIDDMMEAFLDSKK